MYSSLNGPKTVYPLSNSLDSGKTQWSEKPCRNTSTCMC